MWGLHFYVQATISDFSVISREKQVENLKMAVSQNESYSETTEFMTERKERDERGRITVGFKKANLNKLKELVHKIIGKGFYGKEKFR